MKSAIIIWLLVLAVAVGGIIFFNCTLTERKAERPPISVCTIDPDFCESTLEVEDNYGEQKTINANQLQGGL